jgi:protocatechuate 4,5-dioxygenase alpha chain
MLNPEHSLNCNSTQPNTLADLQQALRAIPGTFVFDSVRARQGYHLNMFCMSLKNVVNRELFKDDESAFLDRFPLGEEQKLAILQRDYNRMLSLGGNIYFISKIAAVDGLNFQQTAASMSGMEFKEFREMMISGGRSPHSPLPIPTVGNNG